MKKLLLLFALLFTMSNTLFSCRDTTEEVDDTDATEEIGEDIEDTEIEEEY